MEALEIYDRLAAQHRAAGREDAARALVAPSCEVLFNLRRLDEAETRLTEALRGAEPDDPATTEWVLGLARVAWIDGDTAVALENTERALSLAAAAGDRGLLGRAAAQRADVLAFAGRSDESLVFSAWAIEMLDGDGDGDGRLRLRTLSNSGAVRLGTDHPGTRPVLEESVDLAHRLGDAALGWATINLALHDLSTGAWPQMERRLTEGLEQVPAGIIENQALHWGLVLLHVLRGEIDRAEAHLAAMADWRDSSDVQARTSSAAAAGLIALAGGDLETALVHCSSATREGIAAIGLVADAVRWAWPAAMDAALRLGRTDEGAALLELVATRPPGQVPPFFRTQLARFGARLAAARGERESVEEDLRAAVAGLDRLGYPYWRARAQADLGDWLRGQGCDEEGAALLDEAVATLAGLGAVPALRLLGRDVGSGPADRFVGV